MRNSSDPSVHRQKEQELVSHVTRLLEDDRLRVDTTRGRRPVKTLLRDVNKTDKTVELKRLMAQMNLPDRELQGRMPAGEQVEVVLSQRKFFILRSPVGRLRVACVSPTKELLKGEDPAPMTPSDVQKTLAEVPPPLRGVPTTLILLSTSGFTIEAHELAERRADRTLIMVEPNEAGGWNVYGPPETKALVDLFDPEVEEEKRRRVRDAIQPGNLLTGGIAADRLAQRTQLPINFVEGELKSYAKENPGLLARRLDGRIVLFREGSAPPATAATIGGSDMPFMERVKTLFGMKGENAKKIEFLSERRAALSVQRDRSYEEMGTLEEQEGSLRQQFKDASGSITKRRLTSQLLQLRKDIERRQQLLAVLNQQINVVSTHLHNLELVQQGEVAKLPDSEELTNDAVAAEEMLAQLQADAELAGTVGAIGQGGMTAEEQALYEELEREAGGDRVTAPRLDAIEEEPTIRAEQAVNRPAAQKNVPPTQPRRSEPEAG
ncbi:MAG TPA: hypothetical protein VFE58_15030 [Tepidisphaeraceae bacterium]|jgi:hypothetical protein|nr:hypothetical protein [Tepidisphaeraceae bacterium]